MGNQSDESLINKLPEMGGLPRNTVNLPRSDARCPERRERRLGWAGLYVPLTQSVHCPATSPGQNEDIHTATNPVDYLAPLRRGFFVI